MDNDLIEFMTSCCRWCGEQLEWDDGWVDRTGGDCCSGDMNGTPDPHRPGLCLHENDLHEPLLTMQDFHWEICQRCRGEGILKGYAGVYTSDDFDSGEIDYVDYMMNRRACEDCGCLGKVQILNIEAENRPEVQALLLEHYETEHIYAMERRAGA
jgi:hypothetical protein